MPVSLSVQQESDTCSQQFENTPVLTSMLLFNMVLFWSVLACLGFPNIPWVPFGGAAQPPWLGISVRDLFTDTQLSPSDIKLMFSIPLGQLPLGFKPPAWLLVPWAPLVSCEITEYRTAAPTLNPTHNCRVSSPSS